VSITTPPLDGIVVHHRVTLRICFYQHPFIHLGKDRQSKVKFFLCLRKQDNVISNAEPSIKQLNFRSSDWTSNMLTTIRTRPLPVHGCIHSNFGVGVCPKALSHHPISFQNNWFVSTYIRPDLLSLSNMPHVFQTSRQNTTYFRPKWPILYPIIPHLRPKMARVMPFGVIPTHSYITYKLRWLSEGLKVDIITLPGLG